MSLKDFRDYLSAIVRSIISVRMSTFTSFLAGVREGAPLLEKRLLKYETWLDVLQLHIAYD